MPAISMDSGPSSQPQPQIPSEENDEMDVEEEDGVEDVDVEVDVDVDEVNEEDEGGEVQDLMVVEEEELKKDAKALEERAGDD
jgi:hypothetical protein